MDAKTIIGMARAYGARVKVHGLDARPHAVVKNGVVTNVVMLDPDAFPDWQAKDGDLVACPDGVARGDAYVGDSFSSCREKPRMAATIASVRLAYVQRIEQVYASAQAGIAVTPELREEMRQAALIAVDAIKSADDAAVMQEVTEGASLQLTTMVMKASLGQ